MAIVQIGNQTSGRKLEFQGYSTDIKPILKAEETGSTFLEVDTKNKYVFHLDNWYLIEIGGGGFLNIGGTLFNMLTPVQVVGVATEVSMIGSGLGSLTIPKDTLKVGDIIRMDFSHRLSSGNGQTSTVRIKLGGTTLVINTANLTNGLISNRFAGYVDLLITAVGVNGKVKVLGQSNILQNNASVLIRDLDNVIETTINTTTDLAVDWTYQFGAVNASNAITSHQFLLRKL